MNAKELRQTAEWLSDTAFMEICEIECFGRDSEETKEKLKNVSRHILSTVRDDDDEPVTPERLVVLGGVDRYGDESMVRFDRQERHVDFYYRRSKELHFIDIVEHKGRCTVTKLQEFTVPRNMKEARELLVRCGAIKEEK